MVDYSNPYLRQLAGQEIANPGLAQFQGAQTGNALMKFANAREADALSPAAMAGDKNALARLSGVDFERARSIQNDAEARARAAAAEGRAAAAEGRAKTVFDRQSAADKTERIARTLYSADTPDKFEQAKRILAANGVDPSQLRFEDRQTYIDQAISVADQIKKGVDLEKIRNGGGNEFGLTPVYGKDANGNIVIMQPSKTGGVRVAEPPTGVTVMGPFDKASDATAGKATGAARATLPSYEESAGKLVKLIDEIKADPNLANVTGVESWMPFSVRPGTRNVEAKIAQIQGGTFLQAYNDLRGGGQISNAEGERATTAYNRLAATHVGDPDYVKALDDFKKEVLRLVDIARKRAGQGNGPPPLIPNPATGGATPDRASIEAEMRRRGLPLQ